MRGGSLVSTIREIAANAFRIVAIAVLSAGLATMAAAARTTLQTKPPRQDYTSGPYLYRTFCATCHGAGGNGDGPLADLLRQRPPDLTTIAERRGGAFPRAEIFAVIDGRRLVPGHGSADMPVWGDVLKRTEGSDEAIIKKRIDGLVLYLESLQRK
jgi:mono/diheme cytochrome c family protein